MSKLLHGSVVAHLVRLTIPSIGGMLAIMIFNVTDTWFVSRLGTTPLAAMGFTFPVVMIVGAMAMGFSTGSASIITRALGAGNTDLARHTVTHGLLLAILATVTVSMVGYFTITPLFTMLGASGETLELVRGYMRIWYLGSAVAVMPPICDNGLRATGDMIRPFLVMTTCAVVNVILDPILIFGWGPVPAMGIQGAAIATIIARFCGMTASLSFLHFRYRLIDWAIPRLHELLASWKAIVVLGVPAAATHALNPIAQGYYIRLATSVGGVQAVAAMTTGTRIEMFLCIVAFSYGIALVPFVGHNYGAKAHHRVHEARRISVRFAFIYAAATLLILALSARLLSRLFSDDPEVVRLSATYLLIATFGHVGVYLTMWMSQLLNVIGKPAPVMVINLSRVFVYTVPLCFLGSHFLGFHGLVVGIALANLLAGTQAYLTTHKHLDNPEEPVLAT